MHSQMSLFFNVLSKYQFGFRQGQSYQQCSLLVPEKWEKWLQKGGKCGALLTDLSRTFAVCFITC